MTLALLSLQEWLDQAEQKGENFADFCLDYQARQMELSPAQVLEHMDGIVTVMEEAIAAGMKGPRSKGGLIGGQAKQLAQFSRVKEQSILGELMAKAVAYALAVGECNAAMGRIVAAPTAGASGVLPAILFALREIKGFSRLELSRALVVAGSIGMVIASRASISGAAGGCQAECGAGGAMAAGAAVMLCGGSPSQIGNAVAMTLKNMMGLVCDPVAGLVEVPCVKRNAGAVGQALVAAEMALAGIESVIPVDEVIDAMRSVGDSMHCSLKETAQGGLAVTPTGLAWTEKLFGGK
jgi:L-serine dehydratase